MSGYYAAMRWLFILVLIFSGSVLADSSVTITFKESDAPNAAVAGQMQLYTASYALVIGIDDYVESDWPRLSEAVNDARSVAQALELKGFEVTLLTDLTGKELHLAFNDFFIDKGRDPNSRLFVWFAGHGHTFDGEGYLIPTDGVTSTNESDFLRRSVSLRRFGEYVRMAKSIHVYTVFDSCFAGTIFNVTRSGAPPAITRVTENPVRQFLTSGDAGQSVADDGTFAKIFIEAIQAKRMADLNMDGYLTAEELGVFLTNEISNFTENEQVPRYGKLRDPKYNQGDFVFLHGQSSPSERPSNNLRIPRQSGKFSLDDVNERAELEARNAWKNQLSKMEEAYNQVLDLDAKTVSTSTMIAAWTEFESAFSEDNPYSQEDNYILLQSKESIALLEQEQQSSKRKNRAAIDYAIVDIHFRDDHGMDFEWQILLNGEILERVALTRHSNFGGTKPISKKSIRVPKGEHTLSVRVSDDEVFINQLFVAGTTYELRIKQSSLFGFLKKTSFSKL